MKKYFLFFLLASFLFTACNSGEDLPETEFIMVKFENKTGVDIENFTVSRQSIGSLGNGKKSDYMQYETFGQQYGFALVEAVADLDGKRYYTSSACSGICGTDSAPDGEWLEPGYYKVKVNISDELGGNYLEFIMQN